jgi:hypothetical protein
MTTLAGVSTPMKETWEWSPRVPISHADSDKIMKLLRRRDLPMIVFFRGDERAAVMARDLAKCHGPNCFSVGLLECVSYGPWPGISLKDDQFMVTERGRSVVTRVWIQIPLLSPAPSFSPPEPITSKTIKSA